MILVTCLFIFLLGLIIGFVAGVASMNDLIKKLKRK